MLKAAVQKRRHPGKYLSSKEKHWVEMRVQSAGGDINRQMLRTKLQRDALGQKVQGFDRLLAEARTFGVLPKKAKPKKKKK